MPKRLCELPLLEQSHRASKALGVALRSYRHRHPDKAIDVVRRIDHGAGAYQFRVREVEAVANADSKLWFIHNHTEWGPLRTALEWLAKS